MSSDFSKRLKYLRKEKKVKQKELADIIGISPSTYSKYENGQRKPNHETLKMIADIFKVSVDFLLGKSENRYNTQEQIYSVSDITKEMPDKKFYADTVPFTATFRQQQMILMYNKISQMTNSTEFFDAMFSLAKEKLEELENSDK